MTTTEPKEDTTTAATTEFCTKTVESFKTNLKSISLTVRLEDF